MNILNESQDRYLQAMGAATLDLWMNMPQALQQGIFERAVRFGHRSMADESLREQLARFLHNNHGGAAFLPQGRIME